MIAKYTPPVVTSCMPHELAQGYELALGGDGRVAWQPIAVLMAHGVLECGRDTKRNMIMTACKNWNLGNIKASTKHVGLYTAFELNEYLTEDGVRRLVWFNPRGRLVGGRGSALDSRYRQYSGPPVDHWEPQCRMQAWPSLEDGIRKKLAFLSQPRFAKAMQSALAGNVAQYVADIHQQRYFTANFAPYQRAVVSLFHTYTDIAKAVAAHTLVPIAPILLPPVIESQIDETIEAHANAPSMLDGDIEAVQFDLVEAWRESYERDRRAAVRGD